MEASDLWIHGEAPTIMRNKIMAGDSIVPMSFMGPTDYVDKERDESEVKVEMGGVKMMPPTIR